MEQRVRFFYTWEQAFAYVLFTLVALVGVLLVVKSPTGVTAEVLMAAGIAWSGIIAWLIVDIAYWVARRKRVHRR